MYSISRKINSYNILICLSLMLFAGCSDSEFTTNGCDNPDGCNSTFSWDISEWNTCDAACDGGMQTRTVICKDPDGSVNPDGRCPGTKPATNQICNVQACTSDYTWLIGDWSTCSKTCGGGMQTRSIVCKYKDGSTVEDAKCPTPKDVTERTCNTEACANVYAWKTTEWSACSKTCGNGTQTRIVYCADQSGATAEASLCTGTKPPSEQLCNTQACSSTYTWVTGDWSMCSKTCGGGAQTRSVSCQRNDGQFVDGSFCTETQPAGTQACNTQTCVAQCTDSKTINASIEGSSAQLDILLVVDDSGSMAADNLKLANRLKGFADDLTNRCKVDWQMCVTTTDVDYYKGRPIMWQGLGSHILKPDTPNLDSVFLNTIKWIGHGWSNDEQGIKAMNMSILDNARSNCYRPNASLSVVLISDEDERSVGGNSTLSTLQYKGLDYLNQPASFPKTVSDTFGTGKKFNVNSIIVKDAQCKAEQDAQGAGAKSFYGTKYMELSNMRAGSQTPGGIGSICSADYRPHLNLFADHIVQTMSAIDLECTPVESPRVGVRPAPQNQWISVINNQLIFTPVLRGPAEVSGSYCCAK